MKTGGIALFPFIYFNRLSKVPAKINHETHKATTGIACAIFFICGMTEYIFRIFNMVLVKKLHKIFHSKEKYLNEGNANYLVDRKFYSF
jgi:hypothetical protein